MRNLKSAFMKICITLAFFFAMFMMENMVCQAAEVKNADVVTINKKNFPDKLFRKYVQNKIDKNNDGKLSKRERNKVTKLIINNDSLETEKFHKLNCKGIQYFKNVQILDIDSDNGLKKGIYNVKYILELKKIKKLSISGYFNQTKLNLAPLKKLNTLIIADSNLRQVRLEKNVKLRKIKITHNYSIKKLDLKKNTGLKYVDCSYNQISKLTLPADNVIKDLDVGGNHIKTLNTDVLNPETISRLCIAGTLIQKIDVTKLVHLKQLVTDNDTVVVRGETQNFNHVTEDWDYYDYIREFGL